MWSRTTMPASDFSSRSRHRCCRLLPKFTILSWNLIFAGLVQTLVNAPFKLHSCNRPILLVKGDSSRYGGCQWRARGLQSETPARRSHPHWVSPDCRWRWPVEHPHQLLGRRWMCRCRTPQRITNSSSVRKKFPTSVCRRSTSSTRKPLRHLWLDLNKLLGAADADVAAAGAVAADAAGGGAVAAVVVVVAAAAAGDVAAGRRRDFLNCRHSAGFAPTGRHCAQDTAALTFVIAHDKTGVQFLDRPRRRETA